MSSQQELQALSQELQEIQGHIESLQGVVETIRDEQRAVDEAIAAIETLETESVVQVPLGGGAYVRASIEDIDEVIVELGADYAAEFERDGAVSALEMKKDRLDDRIDDVTERISELEAESTRLEGQAQQLQQQALQQQMQGLQGQERDE